MTSHTAPSGVASASSEYNAYTPAWYAMDQTGFTTSAWGASSGLTTGWLQYEFDAAEPCVAYAISSYGTNTTAAPNTFSLLASNTGAFAGEEVTLDSQSGITWGPSERKEFSFPNTTAYKYYRIQIDSVNGATRILISEIELIKQDPNVAALTAEVTTYAKSKGVQRASVAASASVSADAQRKAYSYVFEFVGEIQLAHIIKTFRFVSEIEQLSPAITIQRVNV